MKKKIIMVLVLGIIIIGFTGCDLSKKTNETAKTIKSKIEKKEKKKEEINLVGTYSLIEMETGEKTYYEENLNNLKESGLTVTLVLREDKTALLDVFGTKQELKYDDNYFYSDGEKISYTFKDGIMKLSNESQSLTFRLDK